MGEYLEHFLDASLIDSVTIKAALIAVGIAEALIPVFFGFTVVYDLCLRTLGMLDGDRPNYFSKKELVRVAAMMLMAGPLYLGIFYPLSVIADRVGDATRLKTSELVAGKDELVKMLKEQTKEPEKEPTETPDNQKIDPAKGKSSEDSFSFGEFLKGGFNVFLILENAITSFAAILISIIGVCVRLFASIAAKIFFAIGPLAVAFSIIPAFKDKISNWFGVYLNLLCTPITLNLLDYIFYGSLAEAMKGEYILNPLSQLAFYIVMIVIYCLTFWFTSFYAGSSSAGRILSTASTIATSAIGYMAGLGGGGFGATGAGKNPSGNIIEDASSITKGQQQ